MTRSEQRIPAEQPSDRSAVNVRSVAAGLLGAILIAAVPPPNNFVANNTFLVGNLMPAVAIGLLLLSVLLINAPLHRLARRWAFSRGELTVAFCMWLVACTIPSAGLMRYLPADLIAPFHFAETQPAYRETIVKSLPANWIFPAFDDLDAAQRGRDALVRNFIYRNSEASGFAAVPWARWVQPAIAWGMFLLLLYGAIICLSTILHHQWARNERLSFPLAEVYSSLLESPAPGRALPPLLRSRVFWGIVLAAMALHLSNGIAQYQPAWPAIPMGYNFWSLFSEEPFNAMTFGAKAGKIMLTVVGVAYFIPTKVAGSLLLFFLLYNVPNMLLVSTGSNSTLGMQRDQTMGAILVVAGAIIYTGRLHWLAVLRAMIGRGRVSDDVSSDLPPAFAGWMLVLCIAGLVTWLSFAGSPVLNATMIVLALLTLFVVTSRIVAETGMIYVQIHTAIYRPWIIAADAGITTTPQGYHLLGKVYNIFGHDLRENSMVYVQSALATADRGQPMRGRRFGLPACMLLAFVVGGASMLISEYNADLTGDSTAQMVNSYGTLTAPRENVFDVTRGFLSPNATAFAESHSRALHIGIGAGITGVVTAGHLGFPGFPVHPIGAVMCYSYALQNTW
ncbi:MAG TPA: hypothetical protein PKB10_08815, partial [Tepidisphaeraceae bacterium]|nr:hypothetical protein [Tepidisphaeraceae bacterium]